MATDIGLGIQAALPTSDVALGGRALTVAHGWQRWRHHATVLTGVILGILSLISSSAAGALGVACVIVFISVVTDAQYCQYRPGSCHAANSGRRPGAYAHRLGRLRHIGHFLLVLGSLPGIYLGSQISAILPERMLQTMLASYDCGINIMASGLTGIHL